jgi:glycosyltransferase involved in cell wall biosynthesis
MNTHGHGSKARPSRVTIGLPVRNGAAHIAQAIETLLNQACTDFEVVVCDNASTDDTVSIVQRLAQHDPRVRLVQHEHNLGGAANFIFAAEQARGEFFCWAAHDDLRDATFLRSLIDLLERQSAAGLACCAVRNIDPDGTPRDVRPETDSLTTTFGMSASQRVRMYLREMPGTPFYGLFRTSALRPTLDLLRELDRLGGGIERPAILGIDMIFLAHFVREHDIACTHEPLLLFRRGGVSHNLGRYGSLREYLRQLRQYTRQMRTAARVQGASIFDRARTSWTMCCSIARWIMSRDMRRMTAHYLGGSMPALHAPRAWLAVRFDRALCRLRRRAAALPCGARMVLFGAGKHTQRRFTHLRMAIVPHATIVAACDDRADDCEPITALPIVSPGSLPDADVLLVSSDTYESAMYRRACEIAPPGMAVWVIYDATIEAAASAGQPESCASTSDMNLAISARESPCSVAARA